MSSQQQLPQPFGKYILLNKIAMGGMAEIFRAKTIGAEGFEKEVVIKRILPHYTEDEAFVTMFIDEARVSSGLNHPNIVGIYDFDRQDDTYYIAMEYVAGKDLKRVSDVAIKKNRPLTVGEVAFVTVETCKGLHYAHTKRDKGQPLNIVHRDVSPHNVMVSYDGEVKVMDFGIAKAAARSTKTRAGTVKGKCAYMSPEQARGKDLDGRSDMFAVGVMMWEMLTNRRLFAGETDFETLSNVLKAEVPPASSINTEVPPELDAILMKCLAKDRDQRQADCKELARELETWMRSANVQTDAADFAKCMAEIFEEDIKALEEMHANDAKASTVVGQMATRARTGSSQASVQAVRSQTNLPQMPTSDARTIALDISHGTGSNRTMAVDSAHAAPKKSNTGLWVAVGVLVAGGGGAAWYFTMGPGAQGAAPAGASQPATGGTTDKPNDPGKKPVDKTPEPPKKPDEPPAPKRVKIVFTVKPEDAELRVGEKKGIGRLEFEETIGSNFSVVASHPDYKEKVREVELKSDGQKVDLVLEKKEVVVAPVVDAGSTAPPVAQNAVLEVSVTPASATLSINEQKQPAAADGKYKVQGYKVGDDLKVEVTASEHIAVKETVKLTSETFVKEYKLKERPKEVVGPGTAKFNAKPWAKVTVKGQSCTTPCSLTLQSGPYSATFVQGAATKNKGFKVKAGGEVQVFVDMTN